MEHPFFLSLTKVGHAPVPTYTDLIQSYLTMSLIYHQWLVKAVDKADTPAGVVTVSAALSAVRISTTMAAERGLYTAH
ncbi:unnamed protein product [Haemonchus placei]|uniref:Peroxisomal membrane protein PEX16 n=1 Tax=Haemonchus placei TaxID=6290 RepID=A0A0N4X602_HAEPC|nr:unnamed protein product [Haemonchus placei]